MAIAQTAGLGLHRRGELRARSAGRSAQPLALAAAGAVLAAGTWWLMAHSHVLLHPRTVAVARGLIVASYAAVGAYTWWRRPASRLGVLIAAYGFAVALASLDALARPLPYSLGRVFVVVTVLLLVYIALSFPRDRLGSQVERRFFAVFLLATTCSWALVLGLTSRLPSPGPLSACVRSCPRNALQLVDTTAATAQALRILVNGITIIALLIAVLLLVQKARSPSRLRRRAVTPLAFAFTGAALSFAGFLALSRPLGGSYDEVLRASMAASMLAVPFCLLVGQIRSDAFATRGAGMIAAQASAHTLDAARVESLIADALGDPTVQLALRAPDACGYLDVRGAAIELPDEATGRACTPVSRNGRPDAVVIHDPSLDTDPKVIQGLVATSVVLLENIRLLEELRASRARIVAAAQRERLRLERDLHDGAQQRLMGIQIKLRMAQQHASGQKLEEELEEIRGDAAEAVEELRELAQGIYPAVLRGRGLADAFRALAMSAPLPIEVRDDGIGRCDGATEAAIYFCALEAIQNTVKHAGTGARVTVALGRDETGVQFAITDDGIGMDTRNRADGLGLTSMRDRIGAVAGELAIVSSPGRGTSVSGTIPDAAPNAPATGPAADGDERSGTRVPATAASVRSRSATRGGDRPRSHAR